MAFLVVQILVYVGAVALLHALGHLLFPPVCQVCREPGHFPLCPRCHSGFRLIAPPICQKCGRPLRGPTGSVFTCVPCRRRCWYFSCARAVGIYDGTLREAIHAFKFHGRTALAEPLASSVGQLVASDPRLWPDLIVPVPLHHSRLMERGFNQSALLAERIGQQLAVPTDSGWLLRMRATASQTELSAADRRANVQEAFEARLRPRPGKVLVVDDVMSTGSTVQECARMLRRAGACEVVVVTVALAVRE